MKSLHFFLCAAFLLAFISALSDKNDESNNLPRVKCMELFGKYLEKITEKSDVASEAMLLKRKKRNIMKSGKCAEGQVWYLYKCWDCKEYSELTGDDC